jgi:hypothetical protein
MGDVITASNLWKKEPKKCRMLSKEEEEALYRKNKVKCYII